MKGFLFYNTFYSYIVGIRIRGTIGKIKTAHNVKFNNPTTYRVRYGKQEKYKYIIPPDERTPARARVREALRNGVLFWHTLDTLQKKSWYDLENGKNIKCGYNYFLSLYIKNFLA